MTRRSRIAIGVIACALVAGVVVVTQVGVDPGSSSDSNASPSPMTSSSSTVHRHEVRAHGRRDRGNDVKSPYQPSPVIAGGKVHGAGLGFVSSEVMDPETSGWTVASHTQDTVVVAGGDARHPSDGLFSILRTSYIHGTQGGDDVRVAGSGPITITKAPVGRKIVVSAQKHGNIEFKSKSGISGTLHLEDDTVTLNP